MNNILYTLGEANSVTILWDTIMTSMACCGVNSYLDFAVDGSAEVSSLGQTDVIRSSKYCLLPFINISNSYDACTKK